MKAKEMMANWLYSDVRIPYSVGMTFTVLAMLFAVFVFGQSVVTSEFSEDNTNHLYANELFLLAFFLIFFTCVLIILSYIPHGIYCIYKKATRHSKDIRKIKRFALSKYTIVFPFVVFGLLLLHLALQMCYGDYLYHHVIFDRDVMIVISVTTVTVIYGIIFGVTAHYFWILLHGTQKKHRYKKISRHSR